MNTYSLQSPGRNEDLSQDSKKTYWLVEDI